MRSAFTFLMMLSIAFVVAEGMHSYTVSAPRNSALMAAACGIDLTCWRNYCRGLNPSQGQEYTQDADGSNKKYLPSCSGSGADEAAKTSDGKNVSTTPTAAETGAALVTSATVASYGSQPSSLPGPNSGISDVLGEANDYIAMSPEQAKARLPKANSVLAELEALSGTAPEGGTVDFRGVPMTQAEIDAQIVGMQSRIADLNAAAVRQGYIGYTKPSDVVSSPQEYIGYTRPSSPTSESPQGYTGFTKPSATPEFTPEPPSTFTPRPGMGFTAGILRVLPVIGAIAMFPSFYEAMNPKPQPQTIY